MLKSKKLDVKNVDSASGGHVCCIKIQDYPIKIEILFYFLDFLDVCLGLIQIPSEDLDEAYISFFAQAIGMFGKSGHNRSPSHDGIW